MKKVIRTKKLFTAFGIFLFLTLSIGAIGIFQIYSLTKTVQRLGKSHLPRERVILEMKASNALYATAVRNYVFWSTSKDWRITSIELEKALIEKSLSNFKNYLSQYSLLAEFDYQQRWAELIDDSIKELEHIAGRIIEMIDDDVRDKDKINRFLLLFENKFYQIDDFLGEILSKSNLQGIENQLAEAAGVKNTSVLILGISLVFSIFLGTAISFVVHRSLRQERLHREMLVQRMMSMEEEERKNLSRQIHDQLSQDLGALKIYLELIEKSILPEHQEQRGRIEKSKKVLINLIDKSHNISELLRPPELDDLGLVESIEALISEYQELDECNYDYQHSKDEIYFAPEHSLALYRVVQEALTNIAKYSHAKNVKISLAKKENIVSLVIHDDGVGFDYVEYLKKPHRRREDKLKLGIQGLQERIELLGGTLDIKTAPKKGTKITVLLNC